MPDELWDDPEVEDQWFDDEDEDQGPDGYTIFDDDAEDLSDEDPEC